jgi:tetratricopeptide (TPR) repeat protein
MFRAQLEVDCGSVAHGSELLAEAQALARERGHPESEGWTLMTTAYIEKLAGNAERAVSMCRRALEVAERIGSAFSVSWASSNLATALAGAGSAETLEVAERCVALVRDRHTSLEGEAQHLANLAEGCRITGDLERARRFAEEAVASARERGTLRYALPAWHSHARAHRAAGDPASLARAREGLDALAAAADEIGAPNWHHLIELERAELAAATGDAAARERHLRAALGGFEAIGADARAAQIRTLLSA